MADLAPKSWGIPVVASTSERDTLFSTPATDQRVQNLETGVIERYSGTAWVSDSLAAIPFYVTSDFETGVQNTQFPIGDIRRYGAVAGLSTAAAANSTAIQNCADSLRAVLDDTQAGGRMLIPGVGDPFYVDTPPIVHAGISVIGEGRYVSRLKKITATASTVSDATAPVYDAGSASAAVGQPICVMHFVEVLADTTQLTWSYGEVSGVSFEGDETDVSKVKYGAFFRGISNGHVRDNVASFCQVGFFFGGGATIVSTITGNKTANCWRGFYQSFMTGTTYSNNYAAAFRFSGHDLSGDYCEISANGADSGGSVASGRQSATEVCRGYTLYACEGCTIEGNGVETHNGPVWLLYGNISCSFRNNLGLDLFSDHDAVSSGLEIVGLDLQHNIDIAVENNRLVFRASGNLTGLAATTGASHHHNVRAASNTGYLQYGKNRYVNAPADTIVLGGWGNAVSEPTEGVPVSPYAADDVLRLSRNVAITPSATFATPGDLAVVYGASNRGQYTRVGSLIHFVIDLDCTSLTFTTGSGLLKILGLPFTSTTGTDFGCSVAFSTAGITFPAGKTYMTAVVNAGSSPTIAYLAMHGSNTATVSVAATHLVSGAALRLQIAGCYPV